MSEQGHIGGAPPSKGRLAIITAGALVGATAIVFGAILPAEFGIDPLRIGEATGLSRLWAPPEVAFEAEGGAVETLAREYTAAYREDTVEIPLQGLSGPLFGNEVEYKVAMSKDATVVYSWTVEDAAAPDAFYYDFHGHTVVDREAMTVATYRQDSTDAARGALTAPFDGVHGWYFQNSSTNPVVIRIHLAGFYDLIPPGEVGNEAGIVANVSVGEFALLQ